MSVGLIGKKCGMTRVFAANGDAYPVTVISVLPNLIAQIKSDEHDGYNAIQVTTGITKAKKVTKPMAGHFAKANVEAGRGLWEFRVDAEQLAQYSVGAKVPFEMFETGQYVDVTSVSKGKGFQGVIKRYNFATQDATHGNSLSHRAPGSIGQRQTPGRVFPGKKMSGHMGDRVTTVQNQKLVRVDTERNLLLVYGAVPGATGATVIVRHAVKLPIKEGSK